MKPNHSRSALPMLAFTMVAGVALLGVALAQPPKPGGSPTPGGSPAPDAPAPGGGAPGGGGPGPGPGPSPGGGGGTPTPDFEFRMCNKTKEVKVIFAATVGAVEKQFRARGWTQIPHGECVTTGRYQRPSIWWHARSPNGLVWGSKFDVDLCVNLNSGFDYTWSGQGRTCGTGETGVPFVKIEIAPQYNGFDMTLN